MAAQSPRNVGRILGAASPAPMLGDLQRAIAGALVRPLGPGDRMKKEATDVANRIIKANDRLTSFERLEIYNQQYWWRLLSSFRDDFRGLRAVLGERKFELLAVAYLQECGSHSWNLRDLGQFLETFLQKHPELTAPHEQLSLEMTRVEWARVIAFDGLEKAPLDPATLGRDPEQLRFDLQPYITLLTLTYPIDTMLGRMRQRNIETDSASNAVSAAGGRRRPLRLISSPSPEPLHIAVHRVDLSVYYKRLEPAAFRLLTQLSAGATLSDACEAAFTGEVPHDAAEKIQSWFGSWTRLQWLCAREDAGRVEPAAGLSFPAARRKSSRGASGKAAA